MPSGTHSVYLAPHGVGSVAIALIILGAYAWALRGEGYKRAPGLRSMFRTTPLIAIALGAFFVLVFGPIAYWVLTESGSHGETCILCN